MNKDLLDDRFGRFRELPLALARRGHQILGTCLSYEFRTEEETIDRCEKSGVEVRWRSYNSGRVKSIGFLRYIMELRRIAVDFKPDYILSFSDSIYGIAGLHVAGFAECKLAFDLFDNFEAFESAKLPMLLPAYRRAVRKADLVSSVSKQLDTYIIQKYGRSGPSCVISNGIDREVFYAVDTKSARAKLELPLDAPMIGFTGHISHTRNIQRLIDAYSELRKSIPNLHLLLAGTLDNDVRLPEDDGVRFFKNLPQKDVRVILSALNVGVVCNRDDIQFRYAFPNKAYEVVACGTPIVAARLGPLGDILSKTPSCLYEPEDTNDLAHAIREQINRPLVPNIEIPTWDSLAQELEYSLLKNQ